MKTNVLWKFWMFLLRFEVDKRRVGFLSLTRRNFPLSATLPTQKKKNADKIMIQVFLLLSSGNELHQYPPLPLASPQPSAFLHHIQATLWVCGLNSGPPCSALSLSTRVFRYIQYILYILLSQTGPSRCAVWEQFPFSRSLFGRSILRGKIRPALYNWRIVLALNWFLLALLFLLLA